MRLSDAFDQRLLSWSTDRIEATVRRIKLSNCRLYSVLVTLHRTQLMGFFRDGARWRGRHMSTDRMSMQRGTSQHTGDGALLGLDFMQLP